MKIVFFTRKMIAKDGEVDDTKVLGQDWQQILIKFGSNYVICHPRHATLATDKQYIILKDVDESSVNKSILVVNLQQMMTITLPVVLIMGSSLQKSAKSDLENIKLLGVFRRITQNVNKNILFFAVEIFPINMKFVRILKKKKIILLNM